MEPSAEGTLQRSTVKGGNRQMQSHAVKAHQTHQADMEQPPIRQELHEPSVCSLLSALQLKVILTGEACQQRGNALS